MAYGPLNDDENQRPWELTVIRAQGLSYLSESAKKVWRPIVTLDIQGHHAAAHNVVLGTDGQCTNLKAPFELYGVDHDSQLDFRVWRKSESKKKRKDTLVASVDRLRLGELLKKQELEKECKLRLTCASQSSRKRSRDSTASRGRPQNGASLLLRVVPPTGIKSGSSSTAPLHVTFSDADYPTASPTLSPTSGCSASDIGNGSPPRTRTRRRTGEDDDNSDSDNEMSSPELPTTPKLRRRKGYKLHSDDETEYETDHDGEHCKPEKFMHFHLEDEDVYGAENERVECESGTIVEIVRPNGESGTVSRWGWFAASLLPSHVQDVKAASTSSLTLDGDNQSLRTVSTRAPSINGSVRSTMSIAQRSVANFTVYGDLREAEDDEAYECVFKRLQTEWTFIGGLLVALSAVDAALLALPTDGVFDIDGWAKICVACSSVAAGIGLAVDAWFLLRYNFVDLHTFKSRAQDVFESYFFFSISARMPAIAMFVAALSLMSFLAVVAFDAWPNGVLVISGLFGVVMSLQFLAFGVHRFARCIAWVVRGILAVMTAKTAPQPEDTPTVSA